MKYDVCEFSAAGQSSVLNGKINTLWHPAIKLSVVKENEWCHQLSRINCWGLTMQLITISWSWQDHILYLEMHWGSITCVVCFYHFNQLSREYLWLISVKSVILNLLSWLSVNFSVHFEDSCVISTLFHIRVIGRIYTFLHVQTSQQSSASSKWNRCHF